MKIKKFQAKTFSEALRLVKNEMGDDAVILSSDEQGGARPYVEVTAAIDFGNTAEAGRTKQVAGNASLRAYGAGASYGKTAPAAPVQPGRRHLGASAADPDGIGQLRRDLALLKRTLDSMRDRGYEMTLPEGKKKMIDYLRKRRIEEELAFDLCDNASDLDDLIGSMASGLKTFRVTDASRVVLMIGPTGVGKTTTIAKLSARAVKNGKKVAIINLDTYRIGAIEQIRIYAKIMGIPLEVAAEVSDLRQAISRFSDRDIIFVDTTGRNPRDAAYMAELKAIYGLGLPLETHLLLSASSDLDFLVSSHRFYRELPVDCIGFTKTDEAVQYGTIYNLSKLYRKPVGYITTGQRVPQDISFPSSERLAGMILKGGA